MATPINKLLIANRGEIAVRIARTARQLGIGTVGIYAEPDVNALHVDSVDVAVALGGTSPAESYLRGDAVIAAAVATGCDAIHPGYGFLAENAGFAQAVMDAGLTWVGPTPAQITLLGDKVAAKTAAVEAGVPTTTVTEAAPGAVPSGVVMPALVKAAAGGGGRGMRIVREQSELEDAVSAAAREAESAFGDGTVFIEPYIENGRHVEVQIMGDSHGNVVHLGERECSIQRRNQKVVEESPSPGISQEIRTALTDGALALARHIGYENAGTVEFLVGDDGTINFLEVNTRLQVEHPVTEAVTGLDLVELQLLVASGGVLPVTQDDITITGHSIEVRLVAEDPSTGWLPAIGDVQLFEMGHGVRVDSGIRSGDTISPSYDSLVAKVISHASTRTAAAGILARGLQGGQVAGIRTNLNTLVAILGEADFLAGATPTSYLDTHPEVAQASGPEGQHRLALLLAAAFATDKVNRDCDQITPFAPSGWRLVRTQGQRQTWLLGEQPHTVEYVMDANSASVLVGDVPTPNSDGTMPDDLRQQANVRLLSQAEDTVAIEVDGVRHVVDVILDGPLAHTSSSAGAITWSAAPTFELHDSEEGGSGPVCPLPGTVIAVSVSPGDEVSDGDVLMVVEAMKMEHKITATADAKVSEVLFSVGDRVDQGDLLVALESGE
jgi:propionyl-CoA carboxylase alpha chain